MKFAKDWGRLGLTSKRREVRWGDFAQFRYGKMPDKNKLSGDSSLYPIFSGYRIVGYYDEYNTDENELIIVARGVGGTGDVKLTPAKCYLTNLSIAAIIDESVALKQYLYYYFALSNLRYLDSGSAQSQITISDLQNVMIPLPTLEEQSEVVDTLCSLDSRIAINKKINHHLEQMAQAIFKSWFVDFEPWDGEMPEGWIFTNLNALCSLVTKGITPQYDQNSPEIVINQKCIRNKSIDLSLARRHQPKRVNEKWLRYGDILINSTGEGTLGRAAQFFLSGSVYTVDSHITIVRPIKDDLVFFLGQWCLQRESEFAAMASGSTGQTDLPRERLKAMDCLLPDERTLQRFSQLLKPVVEKQVAAQTENVRLAVLRDTLLPRLMSGVLSVADLGDAK